MGRETSCTCEWAGTNNVKALIEPPDLILRGGLRKCIPIAQLKRVLGEKGLASGGLVLSKRSLPVVHPPERPVESK